MKKVCLLLLFSASLMSFTSTNNVDSFIEDIDPDTCETMAAGVYYASLKEGDTWQEANEHHHQALTSCCFNYPNDCDRMPVITIE